MSVRARPVWQVSAGPAARSYADVLLKHGVALIGPGDAGPWKPELDDVEFEGGFVRRFASEVAIGDLFVLRTGIATIAAVGLVASDYLSRATRRVGAEHGALESVVYGQTAPAHAPRVLKVPAVYIIERIHVGVEHRGCGLRRALPEVAADPLADGSTA